MSCRTASRQYCAANLLLASLPDETQAPSFLWKGVPRNFQGWNARWYLYNIYIYIYIYIYTCYVYLLDLQKVWYCRQSSLSFTCADDFDSLPRLITNLLIGNQTESSQPREARMTGSFKRRVFDSETLNSEEDSENAYHQSGEAQAAEIDQLFVSHVFTKLCLKKVQLFMFTGFLTS